MLQYHERKLWRDQLEIVVTGKSSGKIARHFRHVYLRCINSLTNVQMSHVMQTHEVSHRTISIRIDSHLDLYR